MLRSLVLLLLASPALAQFVVVDDAFGEWAERPVLHEDPAGDGPGLDLLRLHAASDADYVYLTFELAETINLQNDNVLTLYLDTDADASTGEAIHGIGAELAWTFGERAGTVHRGEATPITHAALGLLTAPTVTGDRFEVALRRDAEIGGVPLFMGDTLRLVLRDGTAGDVLPDAPGGLKVVLDDAPRERPAVTLERERPTDLRVLSYNVLRDGLFDPERTGPYRRILRALAPDVIALQEVYDHGPDEVAARIAELLPPEDGEGWHTAGVGADVLVVSRYPVTETVPLCNDPGRRTSCNAAFRLDLRSDFGTDLELVVAHPPCCANDEGRQEEIDLLVAHLRGRADEAPIVVAGDMNLVGDRQQLETLLTGQIANIDRFGEGPGPALADVAPPATGLPTTATWFDDGETFWPGRLDFVLYSGAITPRRAFALHTPSLIDEERARYGLEPDDSDVSDHLPLVVDFAFVE